MRQVQDALASVGIEAFPGAWKPTAEHTTAPNQYIVYTTMTYEDEHWDDEFRRYRVYVYLNLWSRIDPTEALRRIHIITWSRAPGSLMWRIRYEHGNHRRG